MTASEAARHDLYNGLSELLGPQRAETLMAALPAFDITSFLTKEEFRAEIAELRGEMSDLRAEFKSDLHEGLASVNTRIDRLFLAMMSGFVVSIGTTVGFFLALLN